MLKEIERQAEEEERRRQLEWEQREHKIEQAMKRMGEHVVKRQ